MIELESLHIADTDSGKDNQCSLKLLGTKFIENYMFQKKKKERKLHVPKYRSMNYLQFE